MGEKLLNIAKNVWADINVKLLVLLAIIFTFTYIEIGNYEYFHGFIAVFTFMLGMCMMLISINTNELSHNGFVTFLGIAYGFVFTCDFFHILTHRDIPFKGLANPYASDGFIILTKYIEVISILIAFRYIGKKINCVKSVCIYSVVLFSISFLNIKYFFIFKLITFLFGEYYYEINQIIIIMLTGLILCLLYRYKSHFSKRDFYLFTISKVIDMVSTFTYIVPDIPQNYNYYIANILRLISVFLVYVVIGENSLTNPFTILFKGLNEKRIELEVINKEIRDKNKELLISKDQVEKSRERYKNLVKYLPDAVLGIKDWKIQYVNKATLKLLGAENYYDLEGRDILSIIHPDYKEFVVNRLNMLLKGEEFVPIVEEKFVTLNGDSVEVEVSSINLDFNGDDYILAVARDITDKKMMYERENELIRGIAEEKLKFEFFSNISHELKTPINVIYSALQLEDIYIKSGDIANIEKYNKVVKNNCLRLTRLSNNLIDLTRVQTDNFKPNIAFYDIIPLVEDLTLEVCEYIKDKKITVTFDTEFEEKVLAIDKELLDRIILNILSNAVKFSKPNGNILVCIFSEENNIIISIKDDGVGIPKDKQEEIFKMFSKIDTSFTRKTEGSGIGLSIAKAFVRVLDGEIQVISEEGNGSEFRVLLKDNEISYHNIETNINTSSIKLKEKIAVEFSDIY